MVNNIYVSLIIVFFSEHILFLDVENLKMRNFKNVHSPKWVNFKTGQISKSAGSARTLKWNNARNV